MSTRSTIFATALLCVLACLAASHGADLPAVEKDKIEKLIEHVKGLKETVFIRNDVEYDAATAARFLQGKWQANEAEIRTVEEFIQKAASISTTTGKPYRLRFKDGKEVKSGDYLKDRLKAMQ